MRPSRSLSLALAVGVGLLVAAPAADAAPAPRAHGRVVGATLSGLVAPGAVHHQEWRTGAAGIAAARAAKATGALPARRPSRSGPAVARPSAAPAADVTLGARSSAGTSPLIASVAPGSEQVLAGTPDFTGAAAGVAPPDDAVAANGSEVMHLTNGGVVGTDEQGTFLAFASLDGFFGADAGYTTTDPQVVFDLVSKRWIFTALEYNSSTVYDSKVIMLVTAGSDIFSAYTRFTPVGSTSLLYDQPRLGLTSDKVLLKTEDFSSGGYLGPDLYALNKSELYGSVSGTTIHTEGQFLGPSDFGFAPATNESTGATGFFVSTGPAPSNNLRVVAATGLPTATTAAAFHAVDLPIGLATSDEPPAHAPGGVTIDAGDSRIQNVTWFNGALMAVTAAACTPYNDFTARTCLRFWRIATAGMTLIEDKLVGIAGIDLSAPGGIEDLTGGLQFAATASNSSLTPQLVAFARPAGSAWDTDPTFVAQPSNDYVGTGSGVQRWGDYTGLSVDPGYPSDVWIAGEHVDSASSSIVNWETSVARVSSAADVVSSSRSASVVAPSGAVTIAGKLARPGGAAVPGATLALWKKAHTSATWSLASTGATGTTGQRSFVDHPTVNEDYQWRYAGLIASSPVDAAVLSTYTTAAVSAPITVLVAPKVTIASNKTSMVHGSTVTFSGSVSPNHSGKRVYLQRYLGAGRWGNVTSRLLSTSSTYVVPVAISTRGTFTYRVWFVADTDHTNGYSAGKAIKVT